MAEPIPIIRPARLLPPSNPNPNPNPDPIPNPNPIQNPRFVIHRNIGFEDRGKIPQIVRDLPEFNGNPRDLSQWMLDVEDVLELFVDLRDTFQYYLLIKTIRRKIKGEANDALITSNTPTQWESIKEVLKLYYADKRDLMTLDNQMKSLMRNKSESIESYYSRNFCPSSTPSRANGHKHHSYSTCELWQSASSSTRINELIKAESKSSTLAIEKAQIINLILSLDILNDQLSAIQESIAFAKVGIVNYKLLSTDEIRQIDETLSKQGLHTELLEEVLNLAKVTIGTDNEILLYVINVPTFYPQNYDDIRIEAIFKKSERIQLKGNNYIKGSTELLLQKNPCKRFGNWSLCYRSDLEDVSEDRCISNIVKGIESRCTYEHVSTHPPTVQLSPTTVLLNDINNTLHNTCGITDRNLTGSFIIVYRNCSITIEKYKYANNIIRTINQRIFIPSTSLILMQESVENKIDVYSLHQRQHQHLKYLEHLKSETTVHTWSLIGGFSFSFTSIILIIIFILIKLRSQGTVVQINQKNESTDPIEAVNTQYYQPASSYLARSAV
ncbi:uncharacterized protein LOC129773911 [Toxorhynchites rutilus septentrionalis]|uniref:uncharacterized protein LOC129773911 n=1 Tax=Toxorhynchites rutilus septentrionalis TaxID=329112 RepID=UPI002479CFF3|nr:uncharacterized protein LOC129773911 [Toxorhynchites rutilus septentrionalis]